MVKLLLPHQRGFRGRRFPSPVDYHVKSCKRDARKKVYRNKEETMYTEKFYEHFIGEGRSRE
jgi:hypothetical protein